MCERIARHDLILALIYNLLEPENRHWQIYMAKSYK